MFSQSMGSTTKRFCGRMLCRGKRGRRGQGARFRPDVFFVKACACRRCRNKDSGKLGNNHSKDGSLLHDNLS
jgi:hypothetical protein